MDDTAQTVSVSTCTGSAQTVSFAAWRCHFSPRTHALSSGRVFEVGGAASGGNCSYRAAGALGSVAVVRRSAEPLVRTVLRLQAEGASAVLLVDRGRCQRFDQHCAPGADKAMGEGFARADAHPAWYAVQWSSVPA